MSRIETRIAKAEKCVGINGTGNADTLTDEECEELRTIIRTAMERGGVGGRIDGPRPERDGVCMDIERRIERAEKAVGLAGEPVVIPGITLCLDWGPDDTRPSFPEPVSEWLTVTEEREAAVKNRLPQISIANPFAEYEARHGLKPGTLTKHPLHGKVPFDELLTAAVPDQGEQPCTKD